MYPKYSSSGRRSFSILLVLTINLFTYINAQGPIAQIHAVLKGSTFLPCDILPPRKDDAATLVLWYKGFEENPIYSFDNRGGRLDGTGSHWKDAVFGSRAFFRTASSPAGLSIDDVRLDDEGFYRCRVDFFHSPTRNHKLYFNVIVPPSDPTIYDERGNELTRGETKPYEEGATMTLNCVAKEGRPQPKVQWWRGETLLKNVNYELDETNFSTASVTVTNLNRSHYKATYTCQAVNNNVTMPAYKTVSVSMYLKPLDIKLSRIQQQLSAGVKHDIECESVGSVPAAKITWWKNNQLVKNFTEFVSDDGNISSSVLPFIPTMHDHNATITCISSNPVIKDWKIETSWNLDVAYAPVVNLSLGSELNPNDIEEGDDVYFNCMIKSNPSVYKIIWTHNGINLHQNVKNEILVNNKALVLQKVKKLSVGNYTCVASNVEGDTESNTVELKIAYKPICKPNQKIVYGAAKNEDIAVLCEVDANPEPDSFQWTFNHSREPIPDKQYKMIDKRRGISILRYTPASEMDFGYLACSASNRVGKQVIPCMFQIIPAGPPHVPFNCTLINVTMVSLSVRCEEGFDGGLSQKFQLEISNQTTVIANITSHQAAFSLNRLPAGTHVKMKVYAINAKGPSPSVIVEGSTLKAAEKQTGVPGNMGISPFLGLLICISGLVIVFIFLVICVVTWSSSNVRKSHRPNSLPFKEKTTHALLDHERDEKDPDVIPIQKNAGYQVLRSDSHIDEDITKTMTLPLSSHPASSSEQKLPPEDLNFIDCSEKLQDPSEKTYHSPDT